MNNYYCGDKATCQNLPGSYNCNCFEGYKKEQQKASNKMGPILSHCVDMNECEHNPCHSAAQCTNLAGTFQCECQAGYIGDGIECHGNIVFKFYFNK